MMKWDKDVNVDNIKLAITVRRLESWPVVHDSVDVWYEDLATILEWYDIYESFDENEQQVLREVLLEMSSREEIREAERWAELQSDPVMAFLPGEKYKKFE